jgi:hypothetical protein
MADGGALRRYGAPDEPPFYTHASPTLLSEAPAAPKLKVVDAAKEREWQVLNTHLESRMTSLYNWRLGAWTTWSQIGRFLMPRRFYPWVVSNLYNQGLRQDYEVVDRTGTIVGGKCAAGLMAGLTDPDRPWLVLGPAIPGFEADQDGQTWYEDVTERLNYIYTHSNFYEAQAQHYEDLVFFGTGVVIDYDDEREIIHTRTPCAGEFYLANGFDNDSETLYEEFRLTISQMMEMFGPENLPADAQDMWRRKGGALEYQNIIAHAIEPNYPIENPGGLEDVGVVPGGYTWREVYWVKGKKNMAPLSMSGFKEQPHGATRWNTQGSEAYGRGVGEDMLGDVIQLQLETRQLAESIEKVNRPPMGADVSLQNLPASISPGKITYFNTGNGGEKKFFPLYEIRPDIKAIVENLAEIRDRLARTAFNDVFQPMEDLRQETKTQITATEIDAIKEERLLPLGPVFGRVYGTMRQRVKRHLAIMQRRGLMPPKPPSLQGVPTKIDFISMLTAAQKATSTAAIARAVQFAGASSGAFPVMKYVIDGEAAAREFAEGVGATTKIINPPSKVKKLMAQEAQQAAAAQAMEQTKTGAEAAKGLSETSLAPGSALSALVGGGVQ